MTSCQPSTSSIPAQVSDLGNREHAATGLRLAGRLGRIVSAAIGADEADRGVERIIALIIDAGLADWGGITVAPANGEQPHTLAPTNELVRIIDAVQYRHQEGPCLDAVAHNRPVTSNQLADESRWPTWAPKAASAGISAVLSMPLRAERSLLGAMNLYRGQRIAYDHHDLHLVEIASSHIAALMAHQSVKHHLHEALQARTVTGRAQGILMERYRIDAEPAFGILRRYSQDTNTKLHTIAEQLINTRKLPDANVSEPDDASPGIFSPSDVPELSQHDGAP